MKVHVDEHLCQGHTLCAMKAPEVFDLDEIDGHSLVISEEVPDGQQEKVRAAARSCPERAISVIE